MARDSARKALCGYKYYLTFLLGFYETFRKQFNVMLSRKPTEQLASTSIAAGTASGVVGGSSLAFP